MIVNSKNGEAGALWPSASGDIQPCKQDIHHRDETYAAERTGDFPVAMQSD